MKKLGIIGGMGSMATVDLMKKIVSFTPADIDQDHIPMIIDNNTQIPARIEAIIGKGVSPVPALVRSAIQLECMGADVLMMACNTVHYFYEEVVQYVRIPMLNMINETAKEVKRLGLKKVGLLATHGTYVSKLYDNALEQFGVSLSIPDDAGVKHIADLIAQVKRGQTIEIPDQIYSMIDDMEKQGAQVFILGCTELPIAFAGWQNTKFLDPSEILARKAIEFALG